MQRGIRMRRSKPSPLVTYLNCPDNWISPPFASISDDTRLQRARNSKKLTQDNNDLLEFIGDRVVNLACALMVEQVKFSSEHQMVRYIVFACCILFIHVLPLSQVGRESHQQ